MNNLTGYYQRAKFILWCKKYHIILKDISTVEKISEEVKVSDSTFKNRVSEIKSKYNYRFENKREHSLLGIETLGRFITNKLTQKNPNLK